MKTFLAALTITFASVLLLHAGDSPAEKAFVEKYKKAYESNDKATLESCLYTKGANPMALEFYKMMMTEGAGGKISSIQLVDLTPEEAKKAGGVMDGPGGTKTKLPLKATKKLEIKVESKEGESTGSSTSTNFVGEDGDKLYILVPADAK